MSLKEIKMLLSSKRQNGHLKSLLLSVIVAGFAATVLVIVAQAQLSYNSYVCSPGYVWRDAFDGDLVCVTPQRYAQVQDENLHASEYIDPTAAAQGFTNWDDCLPGYTWRLAGPKDRVDLNHQVDRVCVSIKASDQAANETDHPDDHRDYRYNYPRWANSAFRLDLCLDWNSTCGRAAAENFCHFRSWTGARNYVADLNIGASQPTQGMLFSNNEVCNQTECDGFKYITCYGKISSGVYANPKWQGHRLDLCLQGDDNCGKPAADAYCSKKGFTESFYHLEDPNPVRSGLDTIKVGDGKVYEANKYELQTFYMIICQ